MGTVSQKKLIKHNAKDIGKMRRSFTHVHLNTFKKF